MELTTPGAVYSPDGAEVPCYDGPCYYIECADLGVAPSPADGSYAPGGSFYLEVILSYDAEDADPDGKMSAFQVTLTGCDGMNLQAPVTGGLGAIYALNYLGALNVLSGRPALPNNGWAQTGTMVSWPGGPLPQAGPDPVGGNHDMLASTEAGSGLGTTPGMAVWAVLDKPDCQDFVCCCITGEDVSMGDSNTEPIDVTLIPLCILPEPATALLLLAGLPLLRRRR
jgi:hypothetical protein